MKWSFRVGRVAGIAVYIHVTFLLLLAWVGFTFYGFHQQLMEMFKGLGMILALFGIVLLHELGHALAARRYGIRTRDITLLPIGGVARLERMPDDPKQELVVALAGPAVNVALALLFFLLSLLGAGISSLENVLEESLPFLVYLLYANVFMACFNMLPAFPMDGGRVLRALLAMKMDYVRATRIAASIGQSMALVFVAAGLWVGNPMLLFIALFVWLGAGAEANMTRIRSGLSGVPVGKVMITDFQTLAPEQTLGQVLQFVTAGLQRDYPVETEDSRLVGMLTRDDLLRAVELGHTERHVADIMAREFLVAQPHEMLEAVFARMQEQRCPTLPVVHNERLVGLVTLEQLSRYITLAAAMRRGRHIIVPGERVIM